MLASRLMFDCTPIGDLFGLAVNGQRLRFYENVFYRFEGNLIARNGGHCSPIRSKGCCIVGVVRGTSSGVSRFQFSTRETLWSLSCTQLVTIGNTQHTAGDINEFERIHHRQRRNDTCTRCLNSHIHIGEQRGGRQRTSSVMHEHDLEQVALCVLEHLLVRRASVGSA